MNIGRLTIAGLMISAVAVMAILLSGPGTKWGWWHFRIGLLLFAASGLIGGIGAVVSGIASLRDRGAHRSAAPAVAGALAGIAVAALVGSSIISARGKPAIHDISTDLDDPPRFAAVIPLRGTTSNPVDKTDPAVAAQQREAYPDLQPLIISMPPAEGFARAAQTAKSLGWEVVSAKPDEGRLEATDTTKFFGFHDDIVIRVRPSGSGSRIDLRSASRVGRSDVGLNAKRIRAFRTAMAASSR